MVAATATLSWYGFFGGTAAAAAAAGAALIAPLQQVTCAVVSGPRATRSRAPTRSIRGPVAVVLLAGRLRGDNLGDAHVVEEEDDEEAVEHGQRGGNVRGPRQEVEDKLAPGRGVSQPSMAANRGTCARALDDAGLEAAQRHAQQRADDKAKALRHSTPGQPAGQPERKSREENHPLRTPDAAIVDMYDVRSCGRSRAGVSGDATARHHPAPRTLMVVASEV